MIPIRYIYCNEGTLGYIMYIDVVQAQMINGRSVLLFRMQIECITAEPIEGIRKDKKELFAIYANRVYRTAVDNK